MHENVVDKARNLGRLVGQTDEYKALKRARDRLSDDREMVERLNNLRELEGELGKAMQRGDEPDEDKREEYEKTFSELQAQPAYQSLVAAQSNFDKVLKRVNEAIGEAMEEGAQSGIILPS